MCRKLQGIRLDNPRPNGVVLWEGDSQLTGRPIVCILTGLRDNSANSKTGAMLQTWIISTRIDPVEACMRGIDEDVCGNCPMRGVACYVAKFQAPYAIYYAFGRGVYPVFDAGLHADLFIGRHVRIGSYGDPCAVPFAVWSDLVSRCGGHTGYTHQWRQPRFRKYRRFVMASVESRADRDKALSRGWRTFRAMHPEHPDSLHAREFGRIEAQADILCPASDEAGNRTQCDTCRLCDGTARSANRKSIAIVAHGSPAGLGAAKKGIARARIVAKTDCPPYPDSIRVFSCADLQIDVVSVCRSARILFPRGVLYGSMHSMAMVVGRCAHLR